MSDTLFALNGTDKQAVLDIIDTGGKRSIPVAKPRKLLRCVLARSIVGVTARDNFDDEIPTGTAYLCWINSEKKMHVSDIEVTYYNVGVGSDSNIAANSMLQLLREDLSNCLLANWEQCGG